MMRIAGWVVMAGLTAVMPAAAQAARDKAPELKIAEQFDALLNAGRTADAAALFAAGATARTPDGKSLAGVSEIGAWLAAPTGFHVDSGNRQAWEGGRVTWLASVSHDRFRALGIAPLAVNVDITVKDGLIVSLAGRFTAESRMKLIEATTREQETLCRNALVPSLADSDLQAALPDLRLTVADVLVANDRAAATGTLTGTWTGIYFGVTGTGQAVTAEFTGSARIVEGAVTDARLLVDTRALLEQMGFTVTHPALSPAPKTRKR